MKISFNKYLIILIIVPFVFITLTYSSFNSDLMINGSAMLRIPSVIRITKLKVIEQVNSAYETYSSEFNKDSTSIYATLPNIDSTITYEVTIKNNSTISYDLSNLVVESNSNDNIKYDINIEVGEEISANSEKKFTIKLYYNNESLPTDITDTLVVKYEFVEHINSYVVASYDYNGSSQTFTAPYKGIYKIELWGAQGGPEASSTMLAGGFGAYTSGFITLNENTNLYVYVGNYGFKPSNLVKPFNGGGAPDITGTWPASHTGDFSGGGATDVRLTSGEWDNFDSLKSRIMIAAGGSGGNNIDGTVGGPGGGLLGITYSDTTLVPVPTQTSGNAFGIGQESGIYPNAVNNYTVGADTGSGGGGYYGGYRGYYHNSGGSSGSSFISGHNGCNAISSSSTSTKIVHTGSNVHYSGYKFTETTMIDGDGYKWTTSRGSYVGMPTHDGLSTMVGNPKNGYAKITFIERVF